MLNINTFIKPIHRSSNSKGKLHRLHHYMNRQYSPSHQDLSLAVISKKSASIELKQQEMTSRVKHKSRLSMRDNSTARTSRSYFIRTQHHTRSNNNSNQKKRKSIILISNGKQRRPIEDAINEIFRMSGSSSGKRLKQRNLQKQLANIAQNAVINGRMINGKPHRKNIHFRINSIFKA